MILASLVKGAISKIAISVHEGIDTIRSSPPLMGGVAGLALGLVFGGGPIGIIAGSLAGSALAPMVNTLIRTGGQQEKKVLGTGTLLVGNGIGSVTLWAVGLAILLPIIFVLLPQLSKANLGQSKEATFKLELMATSNDVGVSYQLKVKATGRQIQLLSVKERLTRYPEKKVLFESREILSSEKVVVPGQEQTIDYQFAVPKDEDPKNFKDIQLVSVVEVVGKTSDGKEERETVLATANLGNPNISDQPYGYPAIGELTSIDTEPSFCKDNAGNTTRFTGESCPPGFVRINVHCGTFLINLPNKHEGRNKRECLAGGLDIARRANDDSVLATLDGIVIASGFDRGPRTLQCDPAVSPTGFCYPGLGGYVYLRSTNGKYIASYLHLENNDLVARNLKENDQVLVKRGEKIGSMYPEKICDANNKCTSEGVHVHYQVLLEENNLNFVDKVGNCSEGNLLSKDFSLQLNNQVTDPGPFVCN